MCAFLGAFFCNLHSSLFFFHAILRLVWRNWSSERCWKKKGGGGPYEKKGNYRHSRRRHTEQRWGTGKSNSDNDKKGCWESSFSLQRLVYYYYYCCCYFFFFLNPDAHRHTHKHRNTQTREKEKEKETNVDLKWGHRYYHALREWIATITTGIKKKKGRDERASPSLPPSFITKLSSTILKPEYVHTG